jgi:Flp pilus assembly protein TadG
MRTKQDKMSHSKSKREGRGVWRRTTRSKGQALVVIALMMTVLMLFIGLGVDVANLMSKRSKLQSAVDAAALSAAQTLVGGAGSSISVATTKAYQILEANGVPTSTLSVKTVDFPDTSQVHIRAVQNVDTYFMRLIPAFRTMTVSADATSDLNSYAEINAKPYGKPGIVNELNLMVWGRNSWRKQGDAYSPFYWPRSDASSSSPPAVPTPNPLYSEQPYGYLFRIDVPADYPHDTLAVQIFDPDSYNRSDNPPVYALATCPPPINPTPGPSPTPGGPAPTVAPPCVLPTPNPNNPDMYASCANPRAGDCDTPNGSWENPGLKINAFPDPADPSNLTKGRTAFWRVDELRYRYNQTAGGVRDNSYATTTRYTLWHFRTDITSAFVNPYTISDYPDPPATPGPIATFDSFNNPTTDLSWYQPPGFSVNLNDFQRETNGDWYFYVYVQGIDGSSENDYDLRVGPANSEVSGNLACTYAIPTTAYSTNCYVNKVYYDTAFMGADDWTDGDDPATGNYEGALLFAKRALPLNLDTGVEFPMLLTQVSVNASGQTLRVRHFDQDCNRGCGTVMVYEMQKCGFDDTTDDNSFTQVGQGWIGDNDMWYDGNPAHEKENVTIPAENHVAFHNYSTGQSCTSSWLRIRRYQSYSNDTTVWEMPYIRPRLIK